MTATMVRRGSAHPPLSSRTPARTDDFFEEDQLAELRAYARPRKRVKLVNNVVTMALTAVFVFGFDVGPAIAGWFDGMPWPVQAIGVLAVFLLANEVVDVPVDWWSIMIHDRRHGMSEHTPGLWLADKAKNALLGLILLGIMVLTLLWAIRSFDSWWLVGGLVYLAIAVVINFVAPVVIMPRFNKFTPMPAGELRTRIEEIADLAGVEIEGVYTMDGSKRSRRGNAFVAGFGPSKRVVVFDTMLDFPLEQIAQVVAHEIGHYRLNHIPKTFPLSGLQMLAAFALVQYVLGSEPVLSAAGVDDLGDPAALPVLVMALAVAFSALGVVSAWVSRRNEREADLEALELLGDPTSFVAMWPAFVELNKADLEPSRWARLNASHPDIPERMQFGLDWAALNQIPAQAPGKAAVPAMRPS